MGPGLHHAEVRLPALPAVAGKEVGLLQDGSGEKSPGPGELLGLDKIGEGLGHAFSPCERL